MSNLRDRILFSDNGTITDMSTNLNNYHSGSNTIAVVAAEDKIFLGSDLPFNQRYIQVSSANANASVMTVKLWDGDSFVSAVDLQDETSVGGVSLAQSGQVTWVLDKDEDWDREDTVQQTGKSNSNDIIGLESVNIYDLYWAEITFSADLSAGTAIDFMGYKFSTDDQIGTYYPDLLRSEVLTQFEAGKTNWDEQHIEAASIIARDLIAQGVAISRNNILNSHLFAQASLHKVAELAFIAFGDSFKDNRVQAANSYKKALDMNRLDLDLNANARLDVVERGNRQGTLFR